MSNLRYFHGSLFLISSDNDFCVLVTTFCTCVTLISRQYVHSKTNGWKPTRHEMIRHVVEKTDGARPENGTVTFKIQP